MPGLTNQFAINVDVPDQNSADNAFWGDVIGNKIDTRVGNSLYALLIKAAEFVDSPRLVYPTLANGIDVVSANADWTYGAYATIVPASTIVSDFHIVGVVIEDCDQDAVFELQLYSGAGDDIVTSIRFAVQGGFFGNQVYAIGSADIVADSRIRARLASSNGLAAVATATISIWYYVY